MQAISHWNHWNLQRWNSTQIYTNPEFRYHKAIMIAYFSCPLSFWDFLVNFLFLSLFFLSFPLSKPKLFVYAHYYLSLSLSHDTRKFLSPKSAKTTKKPSRASLTSLPWEKPFYRSSLYIYVVCKKGLVDQHSFLSCWMFLQIPKKKPSWELPLQMFKL